MSTPIVLFHQLDGADYILLYTIMLPHQSIHTTQPTATIHLAFITTKTVSAINSKYIHLLWKRLCKINSLEAELIINI